jgi:ethanolamine utilization protein EutQ
MVKLLTQAMPDGWYQPGNRPIYIADVLDEKSSSPMSVGFARYAAGASNDWTVTYDEVLVITKGTFSVVVDGKATTARAGEAIFLPKGTTLSYRAEEAAEVVYVTYPHWAQATKQSGFAPALDEYRLVSAPGQV